MADERLKATLRIKLNRERIRVNPHTKSIDFGKLDLNSRRGRQLLANIKKEFEITDNRVITDLIQKVTSKQFERYKKREEIAVIPVQLAMYTQLKIFHISNHRDNFEELLKIGQNQYLLVNHTRGTLKPGDILIPKSSPWSRNSEASFQVFREGNELRKQYIYETGTIKKLEMLLPSDILKGFNH